MVLLLEPVPSKIEDAKNIPLEELNHAKHPRLDIPSPGPLPLEPPTPMAPNLIKAAKRDLLLRLNVPNVIMD